MKMGGVRGGIDNKELALISMKKKTDNVHEETTPKPKRDWRKACPIIFIVLGVVVVLGTTTGIILHISDTSPQFCATCHIMQSHVDSYLNGTTLDAVHAAAGVKCKECHSEYKLPQEVVSLVNFVTGNYDPNLPRRKYSDDMCLQCHVSMEFQAEKTSWLPRNPHASHYENIPCRACHISHGEQIDYCSQCHDNGGQRMIGTDIIVPSEKAN
jgi:cytochrome c nitrite reductase small subunit